MDLDVLMIVSVPSLSETVDTLIRRLHSTLGLQLDGSLRFPPRRGQPIERRVAEFGDPGWREAVDGSSWVVFSMHQPGPSLGISLMRLRDGVVKCRVWVGEGSLRFCCEQEKGAMERILFAPLFQIARTLDARAGVGQVELEAELSTDEEVVRHIGLAPDAKFVADLGFLRRDVNPVRPEHPRLVVTERPEGYWLLEHQDFHERLTS